MNITQIQILSDAELDFEDGSKFYEKQQASIGEY